MSYFTIAGPPDCPLFGQALHVAYFLADHLPNFHVTKIEKEADKWQNWLNKINKINSWHHNDSPLIWKEITAQGSKPHYIGCLSKFWEYCYDFFDLECIIPMRDLKLIVDDSMQYFRNEENIKKQKPKRTSMTVCISGGHTKLIWLFLSELFALEELNKKDYLIINIHRDDYIKRIQSYFECINELPAKSIIKCNVVTDLAAGLTDCDLLIIFGDLRRKENENFKAWLDTNFESMVKLADIVNNHAKESLRLILAINGPVCFNATILTQNCKYIKKHNVVAVTADLGYSALNIMSKEINMPISTLSAPPVWGFVGINHIVDIHHIIQKYDIYRPYSRAAKNAIDSSLTSGKYLTELRYLNYKTYDLKDFWQKYSKYKQHLYSELQHPPFYSKIRATISLIKSWYAVSANDNIISLGILSDGIFDFPPGINVSMPVYLEDGIWKPVPHFPLPDKDICAFENFLPFIDDILLSYDIEAKRNC